MDATVIHKRQQITKEEDVLARKGLRAAKLHQTRVTPRETSSHCGKLTGIWQARLAAMGILLVGSFHNDDVAYPGRFLVMTQSMLSAYIR